MTVPFNEPNSRVFWACQAVFVEERNTEAGNGGNPTGASFLTGVQSVGVSSDSPSTSLLDIGRFQREYNQYGQQTFEITVTRFLDRNEETFYRVTESQYTDYQQSHILHANNFGSKGAKDDSGRVLRNYDLTILYTSDKFSQINAGNASSTDPDKNNTISISYLNCLITNISYTMGVDGPVQESVTLTTKNLKYNDDFSSLSDYNLPADWSTLKTKKVAELTFNDGASEKNATNTRLDPKVYNDEVIEPNRYKSRSGENLKRQHFDLTQHEYGQSRLPTEVKELFNFDPVASGTDYILPQRLQLVGIQSINIDVSFDYESLADVGVWRGAVAGKEYEQNRWQVLNLPISVNCSFTGLIRKGMPYSEFLSVNRARNVDTTYSASLGSNDFDDWQEADREIKIVASGAGEWFIWDLGAKNYLTSIEYTGGDAGGGNVEATLNYSNNYSDFIVTKNENVLDITPPIEPL